MSYPLMIGCPACGKIYDYADSEDTFQQKELLWIRQLVLS
jgi:hypothetical protein